MMSALQSEFLQLQNNLKFAHCLFGYIGMGTHILAHSSFSHWNLEGTVLYQGLDFGLYNRF